MGRRGPKAAPTGLKLAKGERRPSRVNREEPRLPKPTALKPPSGLKGAGAIEWKRLAQRLVDRGVLTVADMTAFEEYCRTLTDLRRMEAQLQRSGVERAIAKGYVSAVVKLRAQLKAFAAELGLTPSSRSGVKAVDVDRTDEEEERFFGVIQGGKR